MYLGLDLDTSESGPLRRMTLAERYKIFGPCVRVALQPCGLRF